MEYSIDDILAAKEVVRNAGYGVSLPNNKLDIAKNIAKANGYTVKKAETVNPADDINQALRVATDAGYTVRKSASDDQINQAMRVATDAGYTVRKAPVNPAPVKPAEAPVNPTPAPNTAPASTPAPAPTPHPTPAPTPAPAPVYGASWVEKIASRYV